LGGSANAAAACGRGVGSGVGFGGGEQAARKRRRMRRVGAIFFIVGASISKYLGVDVESRDRQAIFTAKNE
jgi:hypothetical protein